MLGKRIERNIIVSDNDNINLKNTRRVGLVLWKKVEGKKITEIDE
jgi:hypothetical protein